MAHSDVLPGAYGALFLWLEPSMLFALLLFEEFIDASVRRTVSTIVPAFLAWFFPGAQWFHHQLIPSSAPVPSVLDARSTMAIFQLVNCECCSLCIIFSWTRPSSRRLHAFGAPRIIGVSSCERGSSRQPKGPRTYHRRKSICHGCCRCKFTVSKNQVFTLSTFFVGLNPCRDDHTGNPVSIST